MDSPWWYFRWLVGQPGHRMMKKTVLEFCGVTPVRITGFGPVRGAAPAQRERWLRQSYHLGRRE